MSLIPHLLTEIYQPFNSTNAVAPVDWKETPEAHVIKADLPGLKKEELKVEVEDGGKVLQISGERALEKEEENKNEKWHRTDEVQASMENGVLTITIPKQEIKKPEVKNIEIITT
ncbi:hypothetical protein Pfo_030470 [Paulownia fortunei]|nr:hypothetical protein Pfo_030470 [Paulownia fortunei]